MRVIISISGVQRIGVRTGMTTLEVTSNEPLCVPNRFTNNAHAITCGTDNQRHTGKVIFDFGVQLLELLQIVSPARSEQSVSLTLMEHYVRNRYWTGMQRPPCFFVQIEAHAS